MKMIKSQIKNKNRPANLVQTIERVDQLLCILSLTPQGLSLGELAAMVNLPKGTTHRLVSSLAYFDFIRQDSVSRKYMLGFKLVTLGNLLLDKIDFRKEAQPYLLTLARKTNEIVHLAIIDNEEALYIDKIQLSQVGLHMSSRIGNRAPLYCTAVGKVLASALPTDAIEKIIENVGLVKRTEYTLTDALKFKSQLELVRKNGYAFDNEEHSEGVWCVSAPIRNIDGEIIAAVSVSAPVIRVAQKDNQSTIKTHVVETAKNISYQLGYQT